MRTDRLRAYAMYDMGLGFWRNEIAMRDQVLARANGKYKVQAVRVDNVQLFGSKGETKLGLERIVPSSDGRKTYKELTFFDKDSLNDFLDSAGVDDPEQLLSRRLVGLFNHKLRLKWLIPYPYSVSDDEVNVTKIDAGDTSYLS